MRSWRDVKTAGVFLPAMVDAGLLTVHGWPYRYSLTDKGIEAWYERQEELDMKGAQR